MFTMRFSLFENCGGVEARAHASHSGRSQFDRGLQLAKIVEKQVGRRQDAAGYCEAHIAAMSEFLSLKIF